MSKSKRKKHRLKGPTDVSTAVWQCLCGCKNLVLIEPDVGMLSSCDRCRLIVLLFSGEKGDYLHDASHCPNCQQRPEVRFIQDRLGPTTTPAEDEVPQWLH